MSQELEERVLEKLEKGVYDGRVGVDSVLGRWGKGTYRMVIEAGIPKIIRVEKCRKGYECREVVRSYETRFEKSLFMYRYGWLIDEADAMAFSRLDIY